MKKTKWTKFMDMHSGGGTKEKWQQIFIEAHEEEAKIIFYNRFGHNPDRISCTCCGNDYIITEYDDIKQGTAFERGCRYAYFKDGVEIPESEGFVMGKGVLEGVTAKYVEEKSEHSFSWNKEYIPLEIYMNKDDVLFIFKEDIKDDERMGDMPQQGYVWHE